MSKNYLATLAADKKAKTETPQTKAIPGREDEMLRSYSGGYGFKPSDKVALERALILGTTTNQFYATGAELSKEFMQLLASAIQIDPTMVASLIEEVSFKGKGISNSPCLLGLAMLSSGDAVAKKQFHRIFDKVVRNMSHFMEWFAYTRNMRGLGRCVLSAGNDWLSGKSTEMLAYQFLKYKTRNGYSVRDIMRLLHPKTSEVDRQALYKYVVKGELEVPEGTASLKMVEVFEKLGKNQISAMEAITEGRLTHEMVSSFVKKDNTAEWRQIAAHMPLNARLRNLGSLTAKHVFKDPAILSSFMNSFTNAEHVKKARLHPMSILQAFLIYKQGHGDKSATTWDVNPKILDAIEEAMDHSMEFANLPRELSYRVYIDLSGSMCSPISSMPYANCKEGAAAVALMFTRIAKDVDVWGFTCAGSHFCGYGGKKKANAGMEGIYDLNGSFRKKSSIVEVMRDVGHISGGTDVSLPFKHMIDQRVKKDVVILFTDNESWAGTNGHTSQLLKKYRKQMSANTRVIFCTLAPYGKITLVDPKDGLSMDIVGFSPDCFKAIEMFVEMTQPVVKKIA